MTTPLIAAVEHSLGPQPPARVGVAVSGGGDSIALLTVVAQVAAQQGIAVHVITVDHGLRRSAAAEISLVTGLCQTLGLAHHVEYWAGWDGTGNLQARARDGRYELIADWACAHDIGHVLLGHTADDQAETVLMRLARIGGVDGLSGMSRRQARFGVTWLRPFLGIRREMLRDYLQHHGIAWAEDPSNTDRRFERVRVREVLPTLEALGIGADILAQTAEQMGEAREALNWQTFLAARDLVQVHHGAVILDRSQFRTLPAEIRRRLLVHTVSWLSGEIYPPRRDAVAGALDALQHGRGFTLHGCQITPRGAVSWVHRELKALDNVVAEVGELWDVRWQVTGPDEDPEIEVRALGTEALSRIEGWRAAGLPRAAIAVTPGVWYRGALLAAPVAQPDEAWSAGLDGGTEAYFAALLTH